VGYVHISTRQVRERGGRETSLALSLEEEGEEEEEEEEEEAEEDEEEDGEEEEDDEEDEEEKEEEEEVMLSQNGPPRAASNNRDPPPHTHSHSPPHLERAEADAVDVVVRPVAQHAGRGPTRIRLADVPHCSGTSCM
jgi:hypothetical protein